MKKLILAAIVTIAVVSCKKETIVPQVASHDAAKNEKLVAELIQRADENLYAQIYEHNQRLPHVGIKEIHGIFVWSGQPENGTCFPHPTNPCMIIVSALEKLGANEPVEPIIPGVLYTFTPEQEALLIFNTPEPKVQTLTQLKTEVDSKGVTTISYLN